MKYTKIISTLFLSTILLFRCQEAELLAPQEEMVAPTIGNVGTEDNPQSIVLSPYQTGNNYYVSTTGNDASGNGSDSSPWKTLKHAVSNVPGGQGNTIKLSAGTYVETGLIEIPLGVNIEGAGKDQTILKAASSFYHNPTDPGYATNKFLISLNGYNPADGNQVLKNFTINGDSKKLHGGIYVKYRNKVDIEDVKVTGTNFTGIWLWDVKDINISAVDLINCSWGSTGYCVGALNLGNLERVDISQLDIDESTGYGIKAIGPSGYNNITDLKIHDSHVSVHPTGLWNNGSAPNIAIELWQVSLKGCEIYNTYVDNTISLVNSNNIPSTGNQTIRVHHNTLDMESRSNGAGYGVELTIHDAEIDHNYFIKGTYGIANWDNPVKNWNIHHNIFYGIQGIYPGEIVRSQWSGLHNVNLYNNTIEFIGDKTANVVGVYGGTSENVELKNNLIINSNTSYNYYPNQVIHSESGAVINNLQVTNNLLHNLSLGGLLGTILNNILLNPQINQTGNKPEPYYLPASGSPLIDAGINLGYPFTGSAPDIGACEFGQVSNAIPQASLTTPANNASFTSGSSITITASASDTDGTIAKVEFFSGSTKIGEDLTSPYSFQWANVPAGNYILSAKATDNNGGVGASGNITITVAAGANSAPTVSLVSPSSGSNFTAGSTIAMSAIASDSDGSINKVEFYKGGTKLGQDVTSPYSFSWSNVPTGSYTLTARAKDNKGAVTTSQAVVITVAAGASNSLPIVNLTSPSNNSNFSPGSLITINANATDNDGSISKVEFYSDVTKIGEDASSPYSFALAAPASGSYSLTARAIDNQGAVATSSPVAYTVANPSSPQLILDASNASLTGQMTLGSDAQASSYFYVPAGNGKNYFIPPASSAKYNFQIPQTKSYVIWARVKSPTSNNQGYYVYDGKGNWVTWNAGVHTSWTWVKITDAYTQAVAKFNFTQGSNEVQFGWYDDNVSIEKIIITEDVSYIPI